MKAQINTEPSMVNGLHLYSTFPVTYSHPKRFTLLPHIHSHIHTPTVVSTMQGSSQLVGSI